MATSSTDVTAVQEASGIAVILAHRTAMAKGHRPGELREGVRGWVIVHHENEHITPY